MLRAIDAQSILGRFLERAMDDRVLVLGLLLACIANVICLVGYL